MKPDLNLLAVFDAVARTGSVTAAAAQLALSQPAVSHALNRLRKAMGDPLFTRSGRGLVPTPRAVAMLGPVREVLAQAAALMVKAAFEAETAVATFCIGASDYAALVLVPKLVAAVQRAAPGVVLHIQALGVDPLGQLERGVLDFSFWGTAPPPPPFRHHALFDERYLGVARAGHPIFGGTVSLTRYLEFPHAVVSLRDPGANAVENALKVLGQGRKIGLVSQGFAGSMASLHGTDFIANLPSRLCQGHLFEGLRLFGLPVDVPSYGYGLVWHARTDANLGHIWLRDVIIKVAGAG